MKAVIQRTSSATVSVGGRQISSIAGGLLILLGVQGSDDEKDLEYLVNKTAGLRIFKDENQHMNLSIQDLGGEVVRFADFAGEPVVLNFWSTWCVPCKRELDDLAKIYKKRKGEGLEVQAQWPRTNGWEALAAAPSER